MQIETTMRYHLILVRMVTIKKNPQTTNAGESMEREYYTVGKNGN